MSLLRTDAETALDRATELCKEAADVYRTARAAADDTDLAALFLELEENRRQRARELAGAIRQMGNLPGAPDADRETVEHLATRAKAILSPDGRRALLEDCRQSEEKLAAAIAAARAEDLPASTLALLQRLAQEGEQVRRRLSAA